MFLMAVFADRAAVFSSIMGWERGDIVIFVHVKCLVSCTNGNTTWFYLSVLLHKNATVSLVHCVDVS